MSVLANVKHILETHDHGLAVNANVLHKGHMLTDTKHGHRSHRGQSGSYFVDWHLQIQG